ncbi:nicotinamide riboside transporter PnuC [Zunongwangia sp. HGR-M22]|uniref:nicotinamide riboside transporter PnuC n=1 Tax=Zunongwangia sp. HGR-M22 TaxID=3015168 RepID=UPI0022DDBFBA|nr:nicotinamide riboside transporter PnuC [Zunongwangia sp. HGR-M22]WBL25382.1 nicotinamide riboside transporter PnuC [Zunongwangia sp. HGR-M22]
MEQISNFFLDYYEGATTFDIVLEATVFIFGIASVYFSKKENILVYPTGLVATIITVYLLFKAEYYGDMMMNFYYSVMSIYGWINWARKKDGTPVLPISRTNKKEKIIGFGLFVLTMLVTFGVYKAFGREIETANYIDIFTSGIFFTAMWYMAIKKLENWTLWIFADLITVPLYAYRGLGVLALQYIIFTVMAVQGYLVWKRNIGSHVDS